MVFTEEILDAEKESSSFKSHCRVCIESLYLHSLLFEDLGFCLRQKKNPSNGFTRRETPAQNSLLSQQQRGLLSFPPHGEVHG